MASLPPLRAGAAAVPAAALLLTLALAACQQAPVPKAPAAPAPVPAPPAAVAPVPAPAPAPRVALPSTDFPPGPLYFCVTSAQRAPIEYEPRVEQLCRRHPEMGPCQYERNACRAKRGRVFTARGEEVSPAVEAEYDRIVTRVRFPAEGGGGATAKR